MKWQTYHTRQSGETDCGPACIRTVLLRHGITVDIAILRDSTGLGEHGSSLLRLREALTGYGVDSELLRLDAAELAQAVRLAGPAVILLDDEGYRHFVVVHEVTHRGDFVIGDPLTSRPMRLPPTTLAELFHGEVLITGRPAKRPSLATRLRSPGSVELLRPAVRDHRRQLAIVLAATVAVSLVALLNSLFVQIAVDQVLGNGSRGQLALLSAEFIGIALVASGIQFLRGRVIVALSQSLQRHFSERYLAKLLRLPVGYFKSRRPGDLVSRIDDVQEIQGLITTAAVRAAVDLCVALSVGTYLLVSSPLLFAFLIFPTSINILSSLFLFPYIKSAAEESLQRDATLKSETLNVLRGHSEFIGYGQHAFAFGRMARALDRRIVSETRLGRLENINAVVKTANQTVFTVVIAWVGLSQMLSGRLTIGQVFGFLTMSGYFLGSMDSVASLQVTAQRTSAALGRYRDVILQRDDARRGLSEDEAQTPLEPADLRVTDLRFTHEGSGRAALSGVSLIVPHGTSVLLRGANGSGKSTLLGLLGGIHQGYQGSITLGGAEVRRIHQADLCRRVLYVPENPVLVNASLRDNLTLGVTRPTEDILEACRVACFLDVLEAFPLGLDESLRENGAGLSRGQIQRLSIARAVLHAPDIYLFDETFSGIDRETFSRIWTHLADVKATKILVSHGHVQDIPFDLGHTLG